MKIALGTVQFGLPYGIANQSGQVTVLEAKAMLELARTSGIDMIDTAIAYGASESCLGETGVQLFKIVTKLPAIPRGCRNVEGWVHQQVALSLSRLGVSRVYGLLLHRSANLLSEHGSALWNALKELQAAGKMEKIGISIYGPEELDALTSIDGVNLVQAPFNLIDQRLNATGWLDRLKKEGVEIHTRSAFLQGLLLMPESALPPKFLRWKEIFSRWYKWLEEGNSSALQACLAFTLAFPQIDRVVVGADSMPQLAQIIEASARVSGFAWPDIASEDNTLINPARWQEII